MNETILVHALEQLKPFLNDKGIMEIVVRDGKKRISAIHKIALSNIQKEEEKEALSRVTQALAKNTEIGIKNLDLVGQVANLTKIGMLLNGANLAATCVGFAIMYEKLDKMSAEIAQQINQLQNVVKEGNDVQANYEFNKVLAAHTDMLDCRKKKQPYSEEKMRELVDNEYNVLMLLTNVFQKDISADNQTIIFSIFSLLSMFTVSLRFFDEIYYENNHEVLDEENLWHSSHAKWMSAYEVLTSTGIIEKLQDYAMFETNLNTLGADIYYISLLDQVFEQKETVEDNQKLIAALGNISLLKEVQNLTNKEVKNAISEALAEACGETPFPQIQKVYEDTMKQMAVA